MAFFARGGRPRHLNSVTAAGGAPQQWPTKGTTMALVLNNTHGTEPLELFLTLEAATAGAGNGLNINAGFGVDLDVEIIEFWTLTTNAGAFQALAMMRP